VKLTSLRLHNFRQFYGTTPTVEFASGNKKVTVIHGINGAGKTAFLNAFTWALYESLTPGFQLPEQLVNIRALREAAQDEIVEAWVELSFDHNGRQYSLKRSAEAVRGAEGEWGSRTKPAVLQFADDDGEWKFAPNVDAALGRVLPADLHTYFFFDGERIERIVQPKQEERQALSIATKKLLGVTVLERGFDHLDTVRKDFERELKGIGDAQTRELLEQKADTERRHGLLKDEIVELEREGRAHETIREEIQEQLRSLEKVSALQARRDELNGSAARLNSSRDTTLREIKTELSTGAYCTLISEQVEGFEAAIGELKQRGELPSGIKAQFVKALLDAEKCICERDLLEGPARDAVESWMDRAGLVDVEEQAIRMGGEVSGLSQRVNGFWSRLDRLQNQREQDRQELSLVEAELEDISEKLKDSLYEGVSNLEGRLREVSRKISEITRDLGGREADAKALEAEIAEIQTRLDRHQAKEDRQALLQRRVSVAIDARDRIRRVRELMEDELRRALNRKIKDLFRVISVTPYTPILDSDYNLGLYDGQSHVAASQGESQILSFTFIGAVVEAARDLSKRQSQIPGADAVEFPIVMDSPFGSLDPNHRSQICKNLHVLADQVALLVTGTQWRGEVESALSGSVGKSYVLTYHTPRDDIHGVAGDHGTNIKLNGGTYDLVVRSEGDFEFTEIKEV
jgi:DNA sulfur modification protein DndD